MSLNKKDLRVNFVKSIFECLHLWMWAFTMLKKIIPIRWVFD